MSGAHAPSPTLRDVVEALGSVVLEVEGARDGLDAAVHGVVIHDPIDPIAVERGDIVLAVGVRADDPRAVELVRRVGAEGAAAVVLRAPVPEGLVAVGESARIAVLSAVPEVTWGHLHALLRTALGAAGRPLGGGDEPAPTGDLFTLANAVAATIGGPVTIEDPQSRVLAYSNLGHPIDEARRQTILGRRVPPEWVDRLREEGLFAKLWSSDDVVEYTGGSQDRLVIAVRAGDEVLGSVWVADGGKPFQPSAHDALREAAAMAALHLVRHRMGEDLERRMRGELLRALLEGRGSVDVVAQRLGVEVATPATVLAFEVTGRVERRDSAAGGWESDDDATVALARERVRELVVTYCESYRRRHAYVTMDRILYVMLLAGSAEGGDPMAMRLADEVANSARPFPASVRAGVGSTVGYLDQIPQSRAEADRVLEVFARYGFARTTAHVENVRAYAALLELECVVSERPHLRLRNLDELAEHDAKHGTQYVETLRAYLDAFGDAVQAAAAIHVHPNTFRYRLRRLLEISGLDLENPDERIVIELQLRAR